MIACVLTLLSKRGVIFSTEVFANNIDVWGWQIWGKTLMACDLIADRRADASAATYTAVMYSYNAAVTALTTVLVAGLSLVIFAPIKR